MTAILPQQGSAATIRPHRRAADAVASVVTRDHLRRVHSARLLHCEIVAALVHFCSLRYPDDRLGDLRMFDVYLNDKRDLLVVRNGLPIPLSDASGRWRKKKKVVSVSEDIKLAVQTQGYYRRKLTDFKKR
jgi:hypothetical protein